MMYNLVIGPICVFNEDSFIEAQCLDLVRENWMPAMIFRSGPYYDLMMTRLHPDQRKLAKGLIVSVSYVKTYSA